jgi:ketosteroid isomerase-like protein
MSQENVEIVRRVIDAFNRRADDAILDLCDAEVELESALVEKRTYRGLDGLGQYRQDLDAAWEEWHTERDRVLDAGDSQVLHLYRIVGRGRGSGIRVARDIALLWCLREGRLHRGRVFLDQADALRAVGMED